jgi:hypothetical protein
MMSRIDWGHWKISTGRHFQNGRHNTAKIQHCSISSKFDMLVDNDVESIRDIIIYPHMKWRWNRTMLNLCGIVAAILKMVTGRNFSMSGINLGHHNLKISTLFWYTEWGWNWQIIFRFGSMHSRARFNRWKEHPYIVLQGFTWFKY